MTVTREWLLMKIESFPRGAWVEDMRRSFPAAKKFVGLMPLYITEELLRDPAVIVFLNQKVEKGVQDFLDTHTATLVSPTVWWELRELDALEQADYHCSHLVRFIGFAKRS